MDEPLALVKPDNITLEQAATLGVGVFVSSPLFPLSNCFLIDSNAAFFLKKKQTASLGLLAGTGLELPAAGSGPVEQRDEWIIVLGGSGAVGQYGIQIAKLCGYKVLASCSPSKDAVSQLCLVVHR